MSLIDSVFDHPPFDSQSNRIEGAEYRSEHDGAAPKTVLDVLAKSVRLEPDAAAYIWVGDDLVEQQLTHAQLDVASRQVSAALTERSAFGKPVLLSFPPGLEFVTAFFGALMAGAIPIPSDRPLNPASHALSRRTQSIAEDSGARLALTVHPLVESAVDASLRAGLEIDWMSQSSVSPRVAPAAPAPHSNDVAFLQYTSGSTRAPKGTVITHRNLLRCQENIRRAFATPKGVTVVSWLPHFHDMGLVGGLLHPLFVGGRCIAFSPAAFVRRPLRWLELISRYRAELSGAPNFAYDLCVQRLRERGSPPPGLDLSSWKIAFNGAERVRARTLSAFAETFAACGFSAASFLCCYGLAESTLIVTGGGKTTTVKHVDRAALMRGEVQFVPPRHDDSGTPLVGCGRAVVSDLRIVCPETSRAASEGQIGEIWVSDGSVAQGYWQRPLETAETFQATITAESAATQIEAKPLDPGRTPGSGGFSYLRTGDLGFIADGELFVVGRRKDLIILEGRNHYPEDIEETVEGCDGSIQKHGVAAVGLDDGEREILVIIAELAQRKSAAVDPEELRRKVVRSVIEAHDVRARHVLFVPRGTLPRTTSGKLRRGECRRLFLAGGFDPNRANNV